MKKIVFLLILGIVTISLQAQKKNGTVYSEHEDINKTKALWTAFANADSEKFTSYFADSIYVFTNGVMNKLKKDDLNSWVQWWSGINNLKIEDAKPAYPDAIQYNDGGIWVQDWLRFTGTHEETGVNIDMPFHNLYSFNDEGKINSIHLYFDGSTLDEINNSLTTRENGKVYINHPYIVTVRKAINAYCAMDLDAIPEFFAPDARFSTSMMKWGESISLEELIKVHEAAFAQTESIKMKQVGYPDCIYYAENDQYSVYSWWLETIIMKDGTIREYPSMYVHNFNKDGKIVYGRYYVSSNHLE